MVLPAGIVAASSGVWLSMLSELPAHDGELLRLFRISFGAAMLGSLALGARAISQRDVAAHRTWMARAYAIGLGAGTQAFTIGAWLAVRGEAVGVTRAWLMFAGWAINLAVVEWYLAHRSDRRSPAGRVRTSNRSSVNS